MRKVLYSSKGISSSAPITPKATSSEPSSAATNKRVSGKGLMGPSVGRACHMPHAGADASAPPGASGAARMPARRTEMTDTALAASDQNLVWIDLEMTGLYPDRD